MGATVVGERFAAVRGVIALGVMLGAARLPDRLAAAGVELVGRIAPPEPARVPGVDVPAHGRGPASIVASAPGRHLAV